MDKKTPLYETHVDLGATMVPFAGFIMPVQYPKGILFEHRSVREKAGLFDVSHMGELHLTGKDALNNLNALVSNDFTDLAIGKIRYGVLVRKNGTAVDDLLVYKLAEDDYWIVVNASNTDKDYAYFTQNLYGGAVIHNESDEWGQVALQGPLSETILKKLTSSIPQAYYSFVPYALVSGIECLISRTGYTGEDGFELYCASDKVVHLWNLLLKAGEEDGLVPCGLGARDTLRLEAGMPLYGHELNDETTPLDAGLKMFTKLDKPNFIAQEALSVPRTKCRIGLTLLDRGIAREHCPILFNGEVVGEVSSGTMSPTLGVAIAMGYVKTELFNEIEFTIDVRGRILKAQRTKLPFTKK
jgi:aminomethyltransferase